MRMDDLEGELTSEATRGSEAREVDGRHATTREGLEDLVATDPRNRLRCISLFHRVNQECCTSPLRAGAKSHDIPRAPSSTRIRRPSPPMRIAADHPELGNASLLALGAALEALGAEVSVAKGGDNL